MRIMRMMIMMMMMEVKKDFDKLNLKVKDKMILKK